MVLYGVIQVCVVSYQGSKIEWNSIVTNEHNGMQYTIILLYYIANLIEVAIALKSHYSKGNKNNMALLVTL